MKNLVFILFFIFSSSLLLAQGDKCFEFFPTKQGATVENKSYDAANNLICTTTYKVTKSSEYSSGSSIEVAYTIVDSKGTTIDKNVLKASCDFGMFHMTLSNKAFAPDVVKLLGSESEFIGDLLDYPDVFGPNSPTGGIQGPTEFTIRSKKDNKKFISIRVSERDYVKNEPMNTPAGNFYAAKVTYTMETKTSTNQTSKYNCIEWYAPNAGIVRSETYDANNNLLRYNVLSSISGN